MRRGKILAPVPGIVGRRPQPGLRLAFFRAFASIVVQNDTPPGCLIACLLTEECCESKVIRQKLSDLIASADRTFIKVFEQHKDSLRSRVKPEQAATLLTSMIHGLSIRARAGCSKAELLSVCKAFTTGLLK